MMSRRPPLSPGLALRPQLSAVRPEWSRSSCIEGLVERAEVSIRHCVALDPNGMRVVTQEDAGALAVTSRTAGTERLGAVAVRTAVPAQDPKFSAVRPEWLRSSCIEGLVGHAEVSIRHCVALDPNGMRVVTQEDTGTLAVTSRTAGTERLGAVAVRTAVPAQDPKFSAVRPEWLRSSCIEGLVGHAQASIRHCVALDPNGMRAITCGVLA